MTEWRLIQAPVTKIVEEESLHMHRCVAENYHNGSKFWKVAMNTYITFNPDGYSVLELNSVSGLHITSLRRWIKDNEVYRND